MHTHTQPTGCISQEVLLHGAYGRPGGSLGALFTEALPCPAPQHTSRPPESPTGWGLSIPHSRQEPVHPPCPHVQSSEGLRTYLFLPWGPLFQAVLVRLCLPSLRHPLRKKSHHLGLTLMQCDVWGDGKEKASSVSVLSAPSRGGGSSLPHPHPGISPLPLRTLHSLPCCPRDVFVPLSTYPSGRPSLLPGTPCSPSPQPLYCCPSAP